MSRTPLRVIWAKAGSRIFQSFWTSTFAGMAAQTDFVIDAKHSKTALLPARELFDRALSPKL